MRRHEDAKVSSNQFLDGRGRSAKIWYVMKVTKISPKTPNAKDRLKLRKVTNSITSQQYRNHTEKDEK